MLVSRRGEETLLSLIGFEVFPRVLHQLSYLLGLLFDMLVSLAVQGPLLSVNVAFVRSARRGDVSLMCWSLVVAVGLHAGKQECHI